MRIIESYKRWKKIFWDLKKHERKFQLLEMNIANLINDKYSVLKNNKDKSTALSSKEYSIYSQNGEDGILLYLFSQIGIVNQTFIEFGIGDGKQCNSANLLLNFGWRGLMIEGNNEQAAKATRFFNNHPKVMGDQITVLNEFITKENINELFERSEITGEIDLLSIDIDGNDFWIWDAINIVDPRIVVIEYNASFGDEKSITIEYDPAFYRYQKHKSGWYHGASIQALNKLAKQKGYGLVGCDNNGVNAFFIRSDLIDLPLEVVSAKTAYYPEKKRSRSHTTEEQFNLIRHLPFMEI